LKSFLWRYDPEDVLWIRTWEEVIEELGNYHGEGSKVTVIPDGTSCIPSNIVIA
jgi:hypothetical protein